ncbi:hypothetical protein D3C83_136320 [compost metagenome]
MLTGDLLPNTYDILFRANMNGVPGLVSRIPTIKVVVVNAHGHKISCAHFDKEFH